MSLGRIRQNHELKSLVAAEILQYIEDMLIATDFRNNIITLVGS